MLSGPELLAAGAAAVAAGAVNALAGGGTLITFPVLVAMGLPSVAANITNTIALCPGYLGASIAQSADLAGQGRRIAWLLPAGAAGGVLGGVLLLHTGEASFRALVPLLILLASGLLAVQEPLRAWLVRRGAASGVASDAATGGATGARRSEGWIALPVGVSAVYGGYFGAGMSVITLAVLGLLIDDTLTRLNALKQVLALGINVAAAIYLAFSGQVDWTVALVMAVGALVGGAAGGRLAGRIDAATLRRVIVVLGLVVAAIYMVNMVRG